MVYMGDPNEGLISGNPESQPRYYRPIPRGYGGLPRVGRNRGYYDIFTGNTLTEHQYLRRYRRGLSYTVTTPQGDKQVLTPATEQQLQSQTDYSRQQAQIRRERLSQQYQQYGTGIDEELPELTFNQYQQLNNERMYYEYLRNMYRRTGNTEAMESLLSPGGSFANLLESMGLRPPNADWMVGMSTQQPGWPSYYFPGRAA